MLCSFYGQLCHSEQHPSALMLPVLVHPIFVYPLTYVSLIISPLKPYESSPITLPCIAPSHSHNTLSSLLPSLSCALLLLSDSSLHSSPFFSLHPFYIIHIPKIFPWYIPFQRPFSVPCHSSLYSSMFFSFYPFYLIPQPSLVHYFHRPFPAPCPISVPSSSFPPNSPLSET